MFLSHLNLDALIFLVFVIVTLCVGISYGRNCKTIQDYAVGNRNFSTATLTSTIVATYIGGSFFATKLTKTYDVGIAYIAVSLAMCFTLYLIGQYYCSRIGEFLGCNSVAEAMNKLYGKKIGIISAISSIFGLTAKTGMQIVVLSSLVNFMIGINNVQAVILSTLIVVIYSAFGGIRSVTFTDVLQFLTFGVLVPALFLIILGSLESTNNIINTLNEHRLLDFNRLLEPKWMVLLIWGFIPALSPSVFQRVLMANNIFQARRAFIYAAIISAFIAMLTYFISFLIFYENQNLSSNLIIPYIIQKYSYVGLKGLTIAGIAAMVMSTVDSNINTSSVLFTNDILKPLGILKKNKELLVARISAVFIGLFSLIISITYKDLLDIAVLAANFYTPIVAVPLTLAIFGFRSSPKSVFIGMLAGAATIVIWKRYLSFLGVDSVVPAVLANIIFFIGSHYFLKQKGGWVGIKDDTPLKAIKLERKRRIANFINSIKNFNFITFCDNNAPKQEIMYTYFGAFIVVTVFSLTYYIPREIKIIHSSLLNVVYHISLITSTCFLSYPIWPESLKNKSFVPVAWNVSIFGILVCVNTLLVILSDFAHLQSMIFLVNLIVISILVKWQYALFLLSAGIISTVTVYKKFIHIEHLTNQANIQFYIMYSLILAITILIVFFRPKQQYQELNESLNKDLKSEKNRLTSNLIRLSQYQEEFFNRLGEEEKHNIIAFPSKIKKLNKKLESSSTKPELKKITEELQDLSHRVEAGAQHISNVIQKIKNQVEIKLETINTQDLVSSVIKECNKLSNDKTHFVTKNESKFKQISCDVEKILEVLKSLINYAVKNSSDNNIIFFTVCDDNSKYEIDLFENKKINQSINSIKFIISDEGKHFSENKLRSVLTPELKKENILTFYECSNIIDAHYGKFEIKNNKTKGVSYEFSFPSNIDEIRPKVMDLQNIKDQKFANVIEMFDQEKKENVKKIAQNLLKMGVDVETLSKATNLSHDELNNLKAS